MMLVSARTNEIQILPIGFGALAHQSEHLHLGEARRDTVQLDILQRRRYLIEQLLERGRANRLQHEADIGFGVRDERHFRTRQSGIASRARMRTGRWTPEPSETSQTPPRSASRTLPNRGAARIRPGHSA